MIWLGGLMEGGREGGKEGGGGGGGEGGGRGERGMDDLVGWIDGGRERERGSKKKEREGDREEI